MIIGISAKKRHGKDTVCKIIQYLAANLDDVGSFEDYLKYDEKNPLEKRNAPFTWTGGWENKKFAEKLKQIVAILIGCKREDLEDDEFKNTPLPEEWDRWRVAIQMIHDDSRYVNVLKVPQLYASQTEAEEANITKYIPQKYNFINREVYREQLTPRLLLQWIGTEGLRNIIHPQIHVLSLFTDYKPIATGKILVADMTDNPESKDITEVYSQDYYPKWIITDVRFPNEADAIRERGGFVIRIENDRVESIDTHESETALDDYEHFDEIIYNNGTLEELKEKVERFIKIYGIQL